MPKIKIAPSILSSDFGKLNEEIASIAPLADLIHVDVMDGHFVPNLTCGAPVIKKIKTEIPLDIHLMIEDPGKYLEDFVKAGAYLITVHAEACENLSEIIKKIHDLNCLAGVSIKPKTPVAEIKNIIDQIDLVLVMSVEPGFGGQSFKPEVLPKIKQLREQNPSLDIEIDGGITSQTAPLAKSAGANVLVAGSYIFKAKNRKKAIQSLQ